MGRGNNRKQTSPQPQPGAASTEVLPDEFKCLQTMVQTLQGAQRVFAKQLSKLNEENSQLRDEVSDLADCREEIDYLKAIITKQASRVSNLERELDDLNQYNRRENVIFSNVTMDPGKSFKSQVAELCEEIGVNVSPEDMVDAHPLPNSRGKPFKIIARFHQRSKAKNIFANRKTVKI